MTGNAPSPAPGPDLLGVVGATATGKTGLAVALARALDGEVLSADSRQVYRGMDLGTGKDLAEYGEGDDAVPVHLIDLVDAGEEFHLFDYQRAFLEAFRGIAARGRLPILCGGSGLYVDSVVSAYELVEAAPDPELRARLATLPHDELVRRLADLRPLHNTTDTEDRDRLVRAIEIATRAREGRGEHEGFPVLRSRLFGLRSDRPRLRERIARRLEARLGAGLVDEIRRLRAAGVPAERLDRYGLEYRFVTRYVEGEISLESMRRQLEAAIHRFAKRQETWFRRMERQGRRIRWLDAERPVDELVAAVTGDLAR